MFWLFGYLHLEILLRVILSWNNSKGEYNMFQRNIIQGPLQELMEYQNGMVAINLRFTKLVTALRTTVENGEGYQDRSN
jgi:hypothetical protein